MPELTRVITINGSLQHVKLLYTNDSDGGKMFVCTYISPLKDTITVFHTCISESIADDMTTAIIKLCRKIYNRDQKVHSISYGSCNLVRPYVPKAFEPDEEINTIVDMGIQKLISTRTKYDRFEEWLRINGK